VKHLLEIQVISGNDERLEVAGLADERPDPALDDQRRRYYRMTPLGRRAVREEAQRLAGALVAARSKRLFARAKPSAV